HWGEAVTAVVVLRAEAATDPRRSDGSGLHRADDALAEEVRDLVGERRAGYKRPRRVFITHARPHNANGQVDKPAPRGPAATQRDPGREGGPTGTRRTYSRAPPELVALTPEPPGTRRT